MALLGIPTALVFDRLHDYRLARRFATLLMLPSFALTLALNVFFNLQFAVVTNRQVADSFLQSNVSYYKDIQWTNKNLSANSKLLVFPLKTFYFSVPVVRADRNIWDYEVSESAFVSQLRTKGITHIFLPHDPGFLSEYGFASLLQQLQQNGRLRKVYHNPRAVQVRSRTLGLHDYAPLDIFEVIHPEV
ncbi:hypothetical protein MYX75_00325 [Acidobacteria bacterium AH-259-A15]|nr:hypothetical protein [Acidobacteria bacterium AH-259-A15]